MSAADPTTRSRPHPLAALFQLRPRHPAQFVVTGFATAVAVATGLLMLPIASEPGVETTFVEALFTATSAVCITGLTVVDTGTHWSIFGEVVILAGLQVGGFGFMAAASLLGLLVSRRLGLRTRMLTVAESKSVGLGDVRRVLSRVALMMLIIELVLAVALGLRLWWSYDLSPAWAAYEGVFHAVSAFNNGGFALYPDSLMGFARDPIFLLIITAGVLLGSLGFPVILELSRELRTPRTWSLHTKITLVASGALCAFGTLAFLATEWRNRGTIGGYGVVDKVVLAFSQGGVMPRSGGFDAVGYTAAREETWLITDALMFIGGGSAGTAGGIKVTTFAVLCLAVVAEARGNASPQAFGRRLADPLLRQALTVAFAGLALVGSGTVAVLAISGLDLDRVLFEVISAFATCGASTGITADLPPAAQYILAALMFIGRTGTVTLASALALRESRQRYRLPEERTIIG